MITLRPHQVGAIQHIDKALSQVYKAILCVLPTGAGKCHGKDTPVLMYDGSVKMIQDVKIGDVLMGQDSKPRNVLDTTAGFGKLYKVTPVKGESYIVNQNHILSLKQTGLKSAPKYPCQQGKDSIVNIPVEKYINSSKYFKHTHKGWRTGVDWSEKEINNKILPPYLLGIWLGDGTTSRPDITTADPEIEDYIKCYCDQTEQGVRVSVKPNNKASTYHITGRKTLNELRSVGVLGCKHIPDRYKLTSRKNRLELLAGILDSDGHLGRNCYDVVFKVKQLAEDTVFLARSLGFASYMKPCIKKCCNTGVSGEYFRLSISGDVSVIPTRVARHKPSPRKQTKSVLVTGITVEEYGYGDYYGVTIDSDHLYLLGDFTVTHNSLTLAEYARRAYHNKELCVIFAHRDVLISQLSEALCKTGVPHTFICSDKARRDITNNNHIQFGDSYWEETSPVIVSSTPTFSARLRCGKLDSDFLSRVKWWLQDECHHCTSGNQWHTCLSSMPNARGIGFTATPIRGDKKGLGSHADGIFDYLSCTVNMWDLIQAGMLAPYRIFAHGKIDVTGIKRDSNGDLNTKQLRIKTKEADITGDAVEQYRKHLNGKPVITFCINIEHAKEVADEFNTAGIPSIAVSSKQPLAERQRAMDMMRDGRILNLVNVDLLGEGYDCPAVAGVIMMRRTVSYSLFKQQFGRMLRLADGKKYGILIDMVGNTRYMMETFRLHYPHDDPDWTLDRLSDKKIKECPACHSEKFFDGKCRECGYIDEESQYESMECRECGAFGVVGTEPVRDMLVFINGVCPECGHVETEEEKIARVREIKVQAGDLEEQNFDLIDELLAKRESLYVSVTDFAKKLPDHLSFKRSAVNNHATRQSNLDILRHWIQKWSEQMWESTNISPALIQTEFELTFGVNVLRCQADYTASQMDELTRKIQQHMRVIA